MPQKPLTPGEETTILSFRVSPRMIARLRAKAKREGESMATLMRRLIEDELKKDTVAAGARRKTARKAT